VERAWLRVRLARADGESAPPVINVRRRRFFRSYDAELPAGLPLSVTV
jgi:hypothetical protein